MKTRYIILLGIALAIIAVFGWNYAKAAAPITTGMEVVGEYDTGGFYSIYKILDHDDGTVCYRLASSISCVAHESTTTHIK